MYYFVNKNVWNKNTLGYSFHLNIMPNIANIGYSENFFRMEMNLS